MTTTVFQSSFAAGELSPGLLARVDYQKYRVGASLLLNQYVDVRGGVSNRPGTSFVGRSKQTSVVSTPSPVVYLLPGTTSWTVPPGTTLISIEMFGAGGNGAYCPGGGGGWTKVNSLTVVPGDVYVVNVPGPNPSSVQTYTWFGSITTYRAQSGGAGDTFDAGLGGAASFGIGDVKHNGGKGGDNFGGGGGSAGPDGDGAVGGDSNSDRVTGAGGGGANGGTAGGASPPAGSGLGGVAGVGTGNGGDGSGAYPANGHDGFNDQDKGGGGAGGASTTNNPGAIGGTGGFPGGGGGGARFAAALPAGGGGAQIRITLLNGGGVPSGGIPAGGCPGLGTTPRLIPFVFSTIQAYVLEFGNQYMRVIMDGGYVLETAKNITAITKANPAVVTAASHGFSAGDWVFISGVGGMTQVNGKSFIVGTTTTNTFQLKTLDGVNVDSTAYTTYTSGGTVARYFTLATPYAIADVALLKYAQSADVLTITHPSYPPADITRTGNASWTYTPITFAPDIGPPASAPTVTANEAGSSTYRYVVTSVSFATSEESRASAIGSVVGAVMSQNAGAQNRLTWAPVSGSAYYNIYRQPEVINAAADWGQIYGFIGTTTGVSFTDQNIAPDFSRSPPQPRNPFLNSTIQYWTVTSAGTGVVTGATVTVTDASGTGWIGFVEANGSGGAAAIVTQYGGQNYVSPSVSVSGATGVVAVATIGPATGNYPGCVSYFQQRKCFAASTNNPETFWMSQIGNFNNMDVSVPARDSDAITATIASTQVNAIKFLLPMASGLIMGSSSGAWQVSGGSLGEPVTPSNIVASPQAFNGSSDVPPIPVNYDILYVQSKSNVVRDLTYNFYVNNYVGADMTVLANHLFFGFAVKEWAYQDEPTKIVWAIRNDGVLLSFTFLKEQEVYAWCHHDTQGYFISVATIPEGDEDAVYFITQRQVPGQNSGSPVYYVERMQSRQLARPWTNDAADPTNAWFLDCALSYSFGVPAGCALTAPTSIASDANLFSPGSVGAVIRVDDGVFDVTEYISPTQVVGVWSVLPTGGTAGPFGNLIPEGSWTFTTPVQTVTGLDHLEGSSVMVLSNGSVEGPYTVTNGSVTLLEPSDVVVVGLQYTAKGTSMYVDLGGSAPSVAGKRKTVSGLSAYLENSRGLSFSASGFDETLVPIKERTNEQMGQPTRLLTGEFRPDAIYSDWTVEGQTYWYSPYPLPFTLLGIAAEFTFGDNQGAR